MQIHRLIKFLFILLVELLANIAYALPNQGMLLSASTKDASSGRIIVRVKNGINSELINDVYDNKKIAYSKAIFKKSLAKHLGLRQSIELTDNVYVVIGDKININKIKNRFSSQFFHLIEHDFHLQAFDISNDPYIKSAWNLDDTSGNDRDIEVNYLWEKETTAQEVVIGIIDTGVNFQHEDFTDGNTSVFWHNSAEIAGDNIDNDGNGYVDDVHGWNFVTDNAEPEDDNGHGTHVTGIISSVRNNQRGTAGVSGKAKILSLKVLDSQGEGELSSAIKAVQYLIDLKKNGYNIKVINLSFGTVGYSHEFYNIIQKAAEEEITLVAAAGNAGTEIPYYPASFALSNIVAVASHGINKTSTERTPLAWDSSYGLINVDISAPGVDILSTYKGSESSYKTLSGTSMATPHVSALVAVLAGLYPDNYDAYYSWIVEGVKKNSNLANLVRSGGMLDVSRTLKNAETEVSNPPNSVSFSGYVSEPLTEKINGLANLTVSLTLQDGFQSKLLSTTTNEAGYFIFNDLSVNQKYEISISGSPYMFNNQSGIVPTHNKYFTFEPIFGVISGRVHNFVNSETLKKSSYYQTLSDVEVVLTNDDKQIYTTKTDSNGEFYFYNQEREKYFTLSISDARFAFNQDGCFESNINDGSFSGDCSKLYITSGEFFEIIPKRANFKVYVLDENGLNVSDVSGVAVQSLNGKSLEEKYCSVVDCSEIGKINTGTNNSVTLGAVLNFKVALDSYQALENYPITGDVELIMTPQGNTINGVPVQPTPIPSPTPTTKDLCPENEFKTEPGLCGCDILDEDINYNGIVDCFDPKIKTDRVIGFDTQPQTPLIERDGHKVKIYMENFAYGSNGKRDDIKIDYVVRVVKDKNGNKTVHKTVLNKNFHKMKIRDSVTYHIHYRIIFRNKKNSVIAKTHYSDVYSIYRTE